MVALAPPAAQVVSHREIIGSGKVQEQLDAERVDNEVTAKLIAEEPDLLAVNQDFFGSVVDEHKVGHERVRFETKKPIPAD